MQHNNDRKQLSSHSSRYSEGSKYPYRASPGPMEEDTNGYMRASHYDKASFDAQQGSSRDPYNGRQQNYFPSGRSRPNLSEQDFSRHLPTTYHPGERVPENDRYAPTWSQMERSRLGTDTPFGSNDRPQARRSTTTSLARTTYDMDIELSTRERSSSFNAYRSPPRADHPWEREPRTGRLSPTSSSMPFPPPTHSPRESNAGVYKDPRFNHNQATEDGRPIRPLPTGPRARHTLRFPSRSPPPRQTNLSSSSDMNFARPHSPGRYPVPAEHQFVSQNVSSGGSHNGTHAFDGNLGRRSVGYYEEERERLSISTRVDPVPQQSPKRVESLRESLVRDKPRSGPPTGPSPHGDRTHSDAKTGRPHPSDKHLQMFKANLEESLIGKRQRRALEEGKAPILSPKIRVIHILPRKPIWATRPSSPTEGKANNSWTSQTTGKAPPTGPRYLREQQKAKAEASRLRIEIVEPTSTVEKNGKSMIVEDERSSTASTPRPPPTDDDRASEDSSSVAETPKYPPATSWQGTTTSFHASLLRVLANEGTHQEAVVNNIKSTVDAQNRLTVKSHDISLRGPAFFKYTAPQIGPKPTKEDMKRLLRHRFCRQEDVLERKVEDLRQQYRRISRRWERQCQKLDEQNPPEEVVPIPIPETPLTARTGRRNRTGLSDMIHSEFDLEQFVQKQVESDKVDAELLGRMNAAEIPDMISVTPEWWHSHTYNDTNALVRDAPDEYNYWAMDVWAEEERVTFSQMLLEMGKKFGVIAASPALHNRSVQDCVRYYYRSKTDEKYRDLLKGLVKKAGKRSDSRGVASAGELGGLLADIRAGEGRRKGGREDEAEESSDSAYEQEQRRRPGRGRGRGKGRGRGGARGGVRGNPVARVPTPAADADGDVDMAEANGSDGGSPPIPGLSLPSFDGILPPSTNSRKRKYRTEDGDDASGSGLGSKPLEKKKPISSYWTVADRERIAALIKIHGDDFGAIAAELSQKSLNQVKNYIKGRRDLSEVLDRVLLEKAVVASYLTTQADAQYTA